MSIFGKKRTKPIPDGFSADDVRTESSICTGEKTIGFYDKRLRRLMYAEVVHSQRDIEAFCNKYGIKYRE